ncbi:hypothetical protein ACVPPR_00495 [Dellaglioa sp. L3N]
MTKKKTNDHYHKTSLYYGGITLISSLLIGGPVLADSTLVHPVDPINPSQDATPINPKGHKENQDKTAPKPVTKSKTITEKKKLKADKEKALAASPIAFLSDKEQHPVTPPDQSFSHTASGNMAYHISGRLIHGVKGANT